MNFEKSDWIKGMCEKNIKGATVIALTLYTLIGATFFWKLTCCDNFVVNAGKYLEVQVNQILNKISLENNFFCDLAGR